MYIERTKKEVIIRLPEYVDTDGLQKFIDFLCYKEATAKSKANQKKLINLLRKLKKIGGKRTEAD